MKAWTVYEMVSGCSPVQVTYTEAVDRGACHLSSFFMCQMLASSGRCRYLSGDLIFVLVAGGLASSRPFVVAEAGSRCELASLFSRCFSLLHCVFWTSLS